MICQGCDAECPTKPYRVTYHNGNRERVDYCAQCAELARMDWNGETARIDLVEARLFRICTLRPTPAGLATDLVEHEGVGISIHADSADAAVARARQLMPWLPKNLTAISTEN